MRKSTIAPNTVTLLRATILGCLLSRSSTALERSSLDQSYENKVTSAPMHMVLLTQKNYIQFLRWELPVPNIEEFTFCLWMRSDNLTYPHSIFSYSQNEEERLVRAWISARGKNVHLEIGETEVFRETILLTENRWYHVCHSWENREGRFAMWLDGQIKAQGYATKTAGHVIPSGGDIVLGQEYTDFDKGLEEGIEGAVFGFNLLLKSAFEKEIPLTIETVPRSVAYPSVTSTYGSYGIQLFDVRSRTAKKSKGGHYYEEEPRYSFEAEYTIASKGGDASLPLGQQLIGQSYVRCDLGKGSPRIGGSLMLISWSRTPVRVFGGATLKNAKNKCGHF